ncbi:MAG: tyrosine-type recombinase/integrase [Deltaproteobacteria bacterium]|nr:tyrosine-type recombinase/integrase [Deltaproteobacteria bacterium]
MHLRDQLIRGAKESLFPSTKGGRLSNNTLDRWFTKPSAEAGIRRISSHGARHTSGGSYALAGMNATARCTHVQVEATAPVVEARWARLVGRGM